MLQCNGALKENCSDKCQRYIHTADVWMHLIIHKMKFDSPLNEWHSCGDFRVNIGKNAKFFRMFKVKHRRSSTLPNKLWTSFSVNADALATMKNSCAINKSVSFSTYPCGFDDISWQRYRVICDKCEQICHFHATPVLIQLIIFFCHQPMKFLLVLCVLLHWIWHVSFSPCIHQIDAERFSPFSFPVFAG